MNDAIFGARHSARQAKAVAASKVAAALLALIVQVAIARALPVEDYAKFTLFLAAASVLALLSMCGMDRVAFRVLPPLCIARRWREEVAFMAAVLSVRLVALAVIACAAGLIYAAYLPEYLNGQADSLMAAFAAFTVALCITDGLGFFCNGVGRHSAQGLVTLAVALSRSAAVLAVLTSAAQASLMHVLWVYVAAEAALACALLALLFRDAMAQRATGCREAFRFEFSIAQLAREGAATQASYVLRIPFQGPFMRLLVGTFAGPLVTAAYGFFQAIADRIYHFLPTIMFKGVLEPALVADYAKHNDPVRQSMVVALLLKVSLVILFLIATLTLAVGEPVINLATGGKYGDQVWIAVLIGLQLAAQIGGEALWIGLNAVGRINAVNKVWAVAAAVSGLLMLLGYLMRNLPLLIAAATLPYVLAFAWLRWVRTEPLLSAGLGEGTAVLLLAPMALAVAISHVAQAVLPDSMTVVACAGALACAVFALATMAVRPVTRAEQAAVGQVAPRLASVIAPLVARR